jgi:dienelactone hydrolase
LKKILLILILGLFISANAYSDHNNFSEEIANEIVANSNDNTLIKRWKKVAAIKDSDWIHGCDKEDFIKHVAIKEGCVGLLQLGKIDKSRKKLVIFMEGDYRGREPNNVKQHYPMSAAIKDEKENINFFYLARTGHKYSGRKRSVGKRTNSQMSGSWNAVYKKSWDAIRLSGAAIKKLKEYYQPDELIVMGHSGGAGDTLMIAGKMPGLIDKAIVSGCDCLSGWPDNKNNPWESPANQIAHIDPKTKITIITGKKDRETPTEASVEYAKRAKEQGLNVELHVVKGAHEFKALKGRTDIMKAAFK